MKLFKLIGYKTKRVALSIVKNPCSCAIFIVLEREDTLLKHRVKEP
ncbi:hypothetical protein SAMN05421839_11043 [Halolactibacillus halophilus]|nr:hypothetical protein SAMN05421839_11043 [Halolactibacillus halophilus]